MDKIWDRKSFEVGGHWPLWRGWKNRMTTLNRQKSNAKKIKKYHTSQFTVLGSYYWDQLAIKITVYWSQGLSFISGTSLYFPFRFHLGLSIHALVIHTNCLFIALWWEHRVKFIDTYIACIINCKCCIIHGGI